MKTTELRLVEIDYNCTSVMQALRYRDVARHRISLGMFNVPRYVLQKKVRYLLRLIPYWVAVDGSNDLSDFPDVKLVKCAYSI